MLIEARRFALGPPALFESCGRQEGNMVTTIKSEPVPLRVDEKGAIRVGNTRVTLDLLIAAFMDGESAEGITEMFDTLDLGDVYSVLGYYLHHKDEVHSYLQERQRHAGEVRAKIEAQQDHTRLRERLLARLPNEQC